MSDNKSNVVILMPELFHGGAESQFRMLFEHLESSYIAALDKSGTSKATIFRKKYNDRILELKNLFRNPKLHQLQTYINIIIAIVHFRFKLRGKVTLIIYGAGTRWLILYPVFRLLRYKILYSERNDGKHKAKFLYKIMGKCDVITTNSEEARTVISRYVKKKPVYVVNNGVFIPETKRLKYRSHNPLKIVVPARIHEIKNQKFVIDAFVDVPDVEIHFAGKIDDNNYYDLLSSYISSKGIEKKFIFDGFIEDMERYYANFDLIILPSLSEGTPNVLLEGMVRHIPCIASDIPMNRRVIRDDRFLFSLSSPRLLTECFIKFCSLSCSEVEDYISASFECVKREFSIDKMVSIFFNLIERYCS